MSFFKYFSLSLLMIRWFSLADKFNVFILVSTFASSFYKFAMSFKSCSFFQLIQLTYPINFNNSTGTSDRSFCPIFNKRFDHLETLLPMHRPKNVLSAGSLCESLMASPQSKCPKRIFILAQKYHVSVSIML